MKLHVTHDQEGNILAVAAQAPNTEGELKVLADGDDIVSEIEVDDDVAVFADEGRASQRLAEIAERFRVDVAPDDVKRRRRANLVRRER